MRGRRSLDPLRNDLSRPVLEAAFGPLASEFQSCTYCVMDTTDPQIRFSADGVCSHCLTASMRGDGFATRREKLLSEMLDLLASRRSAEQFDSIIGVSGGIDSSVCMEWAAEHELNPLIVHVDAGWITQAAVSNVESLCTTFGFDLETVVIDWEQMRGLQVAFLWSGVANQDMPKDHVLFAALYQVALQYGIRCVIEGRNWQTESILPIAWGHSARDTVHLRSVARRFGDAPIDRLPIMPEW